MCLVTGGGSGLGRATAERLIRGGARVMVADLPDSPGEEVARSLGEDCKFSPTDVRNMRAIGIRDDGGQWRSYGGGGLVTSPPPQCPSTEKFLATPLMGGAGGCSPLRIFQIAIFGQKSLSYSGKTT